MRPVQDTKRSPLKKKAISLPLEIIYGPSVGGNYDPKVSYQDDKNGTVRFKFVPGGGSMETGVADPWEMRGEFLSPDGENAGWSGIALGWGRFGVGAQDISVPSSKIGRRFDNVDAFSLFDDEYREWQSLSRAAMTTKMSEWPKLKARFPAEKVDRLCKPIPLTIGWQQGRPTGIILCTGVLQALIATLQIDSLIGAEYRFCAYRKCGKAFKVKRMDQRYCPGTNCKHNQVVQDGRDLQRKAKQLAEKSENNRGKI